MGSYYQPKEYLKGGKNKNITLKKRGGFYPSIMGGVITHGKILIPMVLRQGVKMFNAHTKSKTKKSKSKGKNKKSVRK